MIFSQPLTAEQRQTSQLNYNRYCLVNGASYMCLGETVVVLFATKLEASNTVIAVIGAMLFLGFLMLPLGVLRTRQVGAAQTQADFWVCRNCAAVMVASSALIAPYSKHLAVAWLLINCFLFYGCRADSRNDAVSWIRRMKSDDVTPMAAPARMMQESTPMLSFQCRMTLTVTNEQTAAT